MAVSYTHLDVYKRQTEDEAVLLLDTVPMRDVNLCHPVVDHGHSGLNQMHSVLFVETGQDAFGEVGVRYVGLSLIHI